MPNALLVEDDEGALDLLATVVEGHGFSTTTATDWDQARTELAAREYDVVVLDVLLPGGSGFDLLLEVPAERRAQVILVSGDESIAEAMGSTQLQELHFLKKPIELSALRDALERVRRRCRPRKKDAGGDEATGVDRLLGNSPGIRRVRELVVKVAATDLNVYVEGESGTGKELVAQAVHEVGRRKGKPFVAVNCGAIPESLIDSELFGHEKGAFTGAGSARHGVFEQAQGGTLFLDEVTEMPIELQVRLLRVLETGSVKRVGGNKLVDVDVRIVAATNRTFEEAVREGRFREDLFHRLCVFPITLPPLRERGEDVELLAERFLADLVAAEGREKGFTREALQLLRSYPWPGNVRQLRNAVQRAFVVADDEITPECLPAHGQTPLRPRVEAEAPPSAAAATTNGAATDGVWLEIGTSVAEAERRLIEATLARLDGNKRAAAEVLGMSLRTLYNRQASYAVENGEDTADVD